MDWQDVRAIIAQHVWRKIHLFDPEIADIYRWLNGVIAHQMSNLIRNLYGHMASPCRRCEYNCLYRNMGDQCPEYIKWQNTKKPKHDIRLPVSMEDHIQEVHSKPTNELNYDSYHQQIIEKLWPILSLNEINVYTMAYVQHKSDKEIIKILNKTIFKKNKSLSYKFVIATKKKVIENAKIIVGDLGL